MTEADLLRENAELRVSNARLNDWLNIATKSKLEVWERCERLRKALEEEGMQLIYERDEAVNAFDELVTLLGVETEYSNLRGYQEIISDCKDSLEAIRAEEREACAKIADDHMIDGPNQYTLREQGASQTAYDIALAIRARGDGGEKS